MTQDYQLPAGSDILATIIDPKIRGCLEALRSLHEGGTAPSSPIARMLWADTTTGMLRIRNAANNGWNDLLPLNSDRRTQLTEADWLVASLSATRGPTKIAVASGPGTVLGVIIVGETATSSSSGNEWQFGLQKRPNSAPTSPVQLFSGTVGTFTTLSGVYTGGDLVAHKAVRITPNQNATFLDLDVFEFTMTKVGTGTTITNFRALLEVK